MATKRTGTCGDCGEKFAHTKPGRVPKLCADCKAPAAKEEPDPATDEVGPVADAYRKDHLVALADMAVARGVDPIDVLLAALAGRAKAAL